MDGLEMYICVILTVEFIYDYWWNSRDNRIKRRKANAKKESKEAQVVRNEKVLAPSVPGISREGTREVSPPAEPPVRGL